MADFREVDPRELRLPPSRRQGADPTKLHRQIALFSRSTIGCHHRGFTRAWMVF
jgi:hypothetical protein